MNIIYYMSADIITLTAGGDISLPGHGRTRRRRDPGAEARDERGRILYPRTPGNTEDEILVNDAARRNRPGCRRKFWPFGRKDKGQQR